MRGLSPVAASGGHSSSRCAGLSPSWPLLLRSTGFRCAGSVVLAHGPSCSAACGIFPDQGSNPCPLHWQADSQPLRHQGSPEGIILIFFIFHSYLFLPVSFSLFLVFPLLECSTMQFPCFCFLFFPLCFCSPCVHIPCLSLALLLCFKHFDLVGK